MLLAVKNRWSKCHRYNTGAQPGNTSIQTPTLQIQTSTKLTEYTEMVLFWIHIRVHLDSVHEYTFIDKYLLEVTAQQFLSSATVTWTCAIHDVTHPPRRLDLWGTTDDILDECWSVCQIILRIQILFPCMPIWILWFISIIIQIGIHQNTVF